MRHDASGCTLEEVPEATNQAPSMTFGTFEAKTKVVKSRFEPGDHGHEPRFCAIEPYQAML